MDRKKMNQIALDALENNKKLWFWSFNSKTKPGIRPRGFEDGLHDWFNFSFTDPRTIDGL